MAQQAQVSEEQARALAEESRESGWDKPSLAKELFLGRFPLELIHPFPRPSYQEAARTEKFLAQLREFLDSVDGSVIERDAQIPDEYVKGLAELGCFGMKIPSEYGGLNMSQVAYNRALMMVGTVNPSLGTLLSAHQSIGVPEPLKLAGTPALSELGAVMVAVGNSGLNSPKPLGPPTPEGPSKPEAALHAVVPLQSTSPKKSFGSPHAATATPSQNPFAPLVTSKREEASAERP